MHKNSLFFCLQASVNLPKAASFDPYTPQINLDSKKVKATQDFCADLKEHLTEMFKPPVEDRLLIRKPGECAVKLLMGDLTF